MKNLMVLMLLFGAAMAVPVEMAGGADDVSDDVAARIAAAREPYKYALGLSGEEVWAPAAESAYWELARNEEFELQPHDNFFLGWTPFPEENTVRFTIAVKTLGYVAFGPTETGGMIGGNPTVIHDDGTGGGVKAKAMHTTDFAPPLMNSDQNVELLAYSQENNETVAQFVRPLIGCRPHDIDISDRYVMRWFAAWGNSQTLAYHGATQRFTVEFNVGEGQRERPEPPPDAFEIDVTLLPMELPTYRDIYFCRGHRFPEDRRYHILISEALLYSIAPATHHHALLFGCGGDLPPPYDDPNHQQSCPVVPDLRCSKYFTGWASGQAPLYYHHPLPIGAGEGAARQFLFQGHIDHPEEIPGIYEPGWGMRFTVTPTLSDVEAGTFGLYSGVPMGGIPPGIELFTVMSECTDRMVSNAFPEGMFIEAVAPHSHSIGRGFRMEQLRLNPATGEWDEINRVWEQHAWDNNWQGNRFLAQPGVNVLPGDRLRIRCNFDTSNRTSETRNGEGFEDEMCIAYISYYPRHSISICAEFPPSVVTHPEMSGPGLTFADVAPYFFPIGDQDVNLWVPPPDTCSA